jgi:hypothetical protein
VRKDAVFIGIDVQISRGCAYYVLDRDGNTVEADWVSTRSPASTADDLGIVVSRHLRRVSGAAAVGIDSPRLPLRTPREWYWDSGKSTWRRRSPTDKGYGRHCEVAIKALGIANPQWTRPREASPPWMLLGYEVFRAMPAAVSVHEVFPSASYRLLDDGGEVEVSIDFSGFARGPKDMLDACIAAVTVREFTMGRGTEVGGGDGMGTIILPRPASTDSVAGVLNWPGSGSRVS